MKKIQQILCAAAVAAILTGCGDGSKFNVAGTVSDPNFEGAQVYLVRDGEAVDSTVVEGGKFAFSGDAAEPWMASVVALGLEGRAMLDFVAEPGSISLDLITDALGGTPLNDSLTAHRQRSADPALEAERNYDSVASIAMRRDFESSMALYNANRDNVLGAYAMGNVCGTDLLTYNQLEELLADATESVKNYKPVADKRQQLKAMDATAVGKRYTDIQGVDGKLSDLIDGRVALVDFYASWCGPCRAEIRDNIVPLWKKYQKKGLVVVGLNVWERGDAAARKAAHEKVMADLGIDYPQLVDSSRTATDTYGVRGIPQIMLIGSDGTILARDLRGAAIEEAVAKALGK
ncbi:MAG: AhpC/TSA family protein [Bacteroidales bacterium]|nr:AhpC/TSA family protein [Bacteroidales bacterium]